METFVCFKDLAIIIISAKLLGLAAKKLKAPQVVGQIVAGLLIGPSMLGIVDQSDFLITMAEVGVVLLMFSAGLETNLKDLVKTGPVAICIACAGVFVPLLGGYLLYSAFYGFAPIGSEEFFKAIFIGTIMTATSVSITVQTLRELGHLKGKVGTIILSAAIIDDIIGIIVLTFVIGFKSADAKPMDVVIKTLLLWVLVSLSCSSCWIRRSSISVVSRDSDWLCALLWHTAQRNFSASQISQVPMLRESSCAISVTQNISQVRWISAAICCSDLCSLQVSV